MYLALVAWASWKGLGQVVPMKEVTDFNGFDYDMTWNGAKAVINSRVNVNRRQSHAIHLTNLANKVIDVDKRIEQVELPLQQMADLKKAIESAKKTKSDPEYLAQQEASLVGWDKREKELEDMLEVLLTEKSGYESTLKELKGVDLRAKQTWEFDLTKF